MEMKVRAVDTVEEKSVQEVEQELLDNHEQQQQEEATEVVAEPEQEPEQEPVKEFGEEDVLSFIRERYKRAIRRVARGCLSLLKVQEGDRAWIR